MGQEGPVILTRLWWPGLFRLPGGKLIEYHGILGYSTPEVPQFRSQQIGAHS
jgi:hypothetical protein